MASSVIGQLRVALSLGTAEFEAGANKAASIAKTRAKEIEGSFAGAKSAVAGLFAAFTVGLVTEQIKKSLEYAGSLREVASTLGVTTTQLQQFRYVASQTGVSQDKLELGLRKLTESMGKAEAGSSKQVRAFQAIHLSVEQLKGLNTGDVFLRLADGVSKYSDRAARAAIETALMSRSGSLLDNALKGGSARINELSEAASRLGIVLSSSQIAGAEETAHKLEAVKMVLAAQIAGVVANNANAILSLSSALGTLTGQIIKFLGSNPQLALGIVGALLGGRVGGLPGAVIGGAAGAILGGKVSQAALDANPDLTVRTQQMRAAQQNYFRSLNTPGAGRALPGGYGQLAAPDPTAAKAEWIRQIHLLQQATGQARSNALPPSPNLPQFLAGKTPHPKKVQDKNEDDAFQLAQQQRQIDLEVLSAKQALSHDISQQAELSLQQLDVQKAIRDAELDHKLAQAGKDLAEHKITQATYDQLASDTATTKLKENEADRLRRQAVLEDRNDKLLRESIDLDTHGYDLMKEQLQKQDALATTMSERRAIELQILELSYREKKIMLDRIIAESKNADEVDKARQDRAALDRNHQLDRQGVLNSTMGPLEQWAKSIPKTAAEINEAFQSIQAQGLEGLSSAIGDVLTGTRNLKQAFGDLAKSVISDLIRMTVRMLIFRAISSILGSKFDSSGLISGNNAAFAGASATTSATVGFATGGSMMIGGNPGTDRNMLALNGIPIMRVGRGETLNVDPHGGGRGGDVTVHQTFQFEGVAITEDKFMQGLLATKFSTVAAIREAQRRR